MIELKAKDVVNTFKVISIPYCGAYDLLKHLPTHFYTSGVYGWNSNIYICGIYAISTGYKPVKGVKPSKDMIDYFTQLQVDINTDFYNGNISIGEYYNKLEMNLVNFCDYVTCKRAVGGK